jgi:predicted dehydrogenase/threonine dehydrogenase-like Zn-dependent dehydrogenase
MKQVLIKNGKAIVENIPPPQCESGSVRVGVHYSCISAGTEMSSIKKSGMPLWQLALDQPQHVKKVFQSINHFGISRTYSLVTGQLSAGIATGYSVAGEVLAIGKNVKKWRVGDRVACAGAQYAHHAEVIVAPQNLTVGIPDNISYSHASTVTLGAIALQGIRRANPTLGENIVVIGLGILGQLTVQILQANGCHVIGIDIDPARVELAKKLGMEIGFSLPCENEIETVQRYTQGVGADAVIITASTPSSSVIANAFKMCRKKARVILVGDVGLSLSRKDFYEKELDFLISCSYGPGRYDEKYEEGGLDYPIGYVRWTENRNMSEYLRLIADGKVKINELIHKTFTIDKASDAYAALNNSESDSKPLIVLLEYPESGEIKSDKVINPSIVHFSKEKVRLAVAGAGHFAKGMHLPNLAKLNQHYQLRAVMSRSGHNAKATAHQYGAIYATTEYQQLLDDAEIDAVLIATRHDLHCQLTLQALQAGKHVLVEKPLALTREELQKIVEFYSQNKTSFPVLLTGFNRRFSIYNQQIQRLIAERSGPMIINYRMNAGYIAMDNWVHGPQGGGRNLGEACHIYDLFTFFANSPVINISAQPIASKTDYYSSSDNFAATISFADGTIANLIYTALGNKHYPKEQMEIFFDGSVITLNDYKNLTVIGKKFKGIKKSTPNKGQFEELSEFAKAIRNGENWPIPLWQQIQATEISFQVEHQLRSQTCAE